jgi:nitrite reductase/ring-hydroxylating ferredoxin subunit
MVMVEAAEIWRTRPYAPNSGDVLGPLDSIADGQAKEFVFGRGRGAFHMFVVRKGVNVYGYLNICPHFSLPLNHRPDDFMSADGQRIRCTRHFALFQVENGLCDAGACENLFLDAVPVHLHAGEIVVS